MTNERDTTEAEGTRMVVEDGILVFKRGGDGKASSRSEDAGVKTGVPGLLTQHTPAADTAKADRPWRMAVEDGILVFNETGDGNAPSPSEDAGVKTGGAATSTQQSPAATAASMPEPSVEAVPHGTEPAKVKG